MRQCSTSCRRTIDRKSTWTGSRKRRAPVRAPIFGWLRAVPANGRKCVRHPDIQVLFSSHVETVMLLSRVRDSRHRESICSAGANACDVQHSQASRASGPGIAIRGLISCCQRKSRQIQGLSPAASRKKRSAYAVTPRRTPRTRVDACAHGGAARASGGWFRRASFLHRISVSEHRHRTESASVVRPQVQQDLPWKAPVRTHPLSEGRTQAGIQVLEAMQAIPKISSEQPALPLHEDVFGGRKHTSRTDCQKGLQDTGVSGQESVQKVRA